MMGASKFVSKPTAATDRKYKLSGQIGDKWEGFGMIPKGDRKQLELKQFFFIYFSTVLSLHVYGADVCLPQTPHRRHY